MTLFATYKDKSDGVIRFYDLKERRNRIAIVLIYAACILMSFLFLYPVVWLLFACFKDTNELFQSLSIIPQELDLDGLARSWKRLDFGQRLFLVAVSMAWAASFAPWCSRPVRLRARRGQDAWAQADLEPADGASVGAFHGRLCRAIPLFCATGHQPRANLAALSGVGRFAVHHHDVQGVL